MGCFLDESRAADVIEVLQASELSLGGIHIMAIGLRGLLKKDLVAEGSI